MNTISKNTETAINQILALKHPCFFGITTPKAVPSNYWEECKKDLFDARRDVESVLLNFDASTLREVCTVFLSGKDIPHSEIVDYLDGFSKNSEYVDYLVSVTPLLQKYLILGKQSLSAA